LTPQHKHKQFPESQAFLLNNQIRRLINPPERLISKLNLGSNDTVVDFGCGPGFFLLPIAKVAGKAVGVDVSQRMLEKASQHVKKEREHVEFQQSDGTSLRLADESVDLILLNHVFHEVEDKPRMLGEFRRILKPSGRLAIAERTRAAKGPWNKFGPPVIDPKEVTTSIEQLGFSVKETIPYGRDCVIISQKSTTGP
jgi:ubiquinone/menaquinone biosynthesis C-methylase UbiE